MASRSVPAGRRPYRRRLASSSTVTSSPRPDRRIAAPLRRASSAWLVCIASAPKDGQARGAADHEEGVIAGEAERANPPPYAHRDLRPPPREPDPLQRVGRTPAIFRHPPEL